MQRCHAMVLLLALSTACATGRPTSEAETPETVEPEETVAKTESADERASLVYEDLELNVEQTRFLVEHKWPAPGGAEPTVEIIDAAHARALLETEWHGTWFDLEADEPLPKYVNMLLDHPQAKAVLADTHAGLGGPPKVLSLPYPKEPAAPGKGSGITFKLGVEPVHTGDLIAESDDPAEHWELDEERTDPGFPDLSVEELESKMEAGDSFVLFVGAEGCGSSDRLSPWFKAYFEATDIGVPIFQTLASQQGHSIAREIVPWQWISFPTLLVFDEGRVVDMGSGGGSSAYGRARIDNLLARNGLIDAPVRMLTDYTDKPDDRARRVRSLSSHGVLPHANFAGADLSGVNWKSAKLDGSNFAGATLRDADLSYANLAHANFKGADLSGAAVEGAFWSNTTCPDGTNSDDHGFTCEGHLEAAE